MSNGMYNIMRKLAYSNCSASSGTKNWSMFGHVTHIHFLMQNDWLLHVLLNHARAHTEARTKTADEDCSREAFNEERLFYIYRSASLVEPYPMLSLTWCVECGSC